MPNTNLGGLFNGLRGDGGIGRFEKIGYMRKHIPDLNKAEIKEYDEDNEIRNRAKAEADKLPIECLISELKELARK